MALIPKFLFILCTYCNVVNKIESFQRQLNLYGFRRLASGRGTYYHQLFQRGREDLLAEIQLVKVVPRSRRSGGRKQSSSAQNQEEYDEGLEGGCVRDDSIGLLELGCAEDTVADSLLTLRNIRYDISPASVPGTPDSKSSKHAPSLTDRTDSSSKGNSAHSHLSSDDLHSRLVSDGKRNAKENRIKGIPPLSKNSSSVSLNKQVEGPLERFNDESHYRFHPMFPYPPSMYSGWAAQQQFPGQPLPYPMPPMTGQFASPQYMTAADANRMRDWMMQFPPLGFNYLFGGDMARSGHMNPLAPMYGRAPSPVFDAQASLPTPSAPKRPRTTTRHASEVSETSTYNNMRDVVGGGFDTSSSGAVPADSLNVVPVAPEMFYYKRKQTSKSRASSTVDELSTPIDSSSSALLSGEAQLSARTQSEGDQSEGQSDSHSDTHSLSHSEASMPSPRLPEDEIRKSVASALYTMRVSTV